MAKKQLIKTIAHSHKVIGLAKQLIDMKLLTVDSPARFRLMPDILPSDHDKRTSFLQNLSIYARVGLALPSDRLLEIIDAETDGKICEVASSKVVMNEGYVFI